MRGLLSPSAIIVIDVLILKLAPDALAFTARGDAYNRKGEYDRAIQDYDRSLKLKPDDPDALINRGIAYMGKDQCDLAIRGFDRALEIRPDDANALFNRGLCYFETAQYDHALQDYDRVVKLKPDFVGAFRQRCSTRSVLGGPPETALANCNEALRLTPNDPLLLKSRGLAYLKMNQPAAAIPDYDAALKIAPGDAGALYGRGVARRRKGDVKGGDADIVVAKASQSDIADNFASWGVREK